MAVGTQSRQGCWASGSVRSVRSSDSSAPLLASGRNSRCTHSRCTPPPSETRRHMLLRTWVREMPPLPAGEPPSLPWPSPASPLPSPSAQGGWEDGSGVVSNTRRNQYIGIPAFELAFSRQLPGQKPQSRTAKHAPPPRTRLIAVGGQAAHRGGQQSLLQLLQLALHKVVGQHGPVSKATAGRPTVPCRSGLHPAACICQCSSSTPAAHSRAPARASQHSTCNPTCSRLRSAAAVGASLLSSSSPAAAACKWHRSMQDDVGAWLTSGGTACRGVVSRQQAARASHQCTAAGLSCCSTAGRLATKRARCAATHPP